MKEKYTSLITKTVATAIFSDGTTKAVFAGTPRFNQVVDAIKQKVPEEQLKLMMDGKTYIQYWAAGEFEIKNNQVTWTRHPKYEIPKVLQNKLFEYAEDGYPSEAFSKFLSRLLRNPSNRSVETFYGFIEQQGLTIDDDGFVIGYKGVKDDLTDCYTGHFDNSPGRKHEMPRNHVDDDPNNPCSVGFHFGGWSYASTFGERMILVKVDPEDLVCVPHDCSQGKVRCCRYEVLKEVPRDTKMKAYLDAPGRPEEDPFEEPDGLECDSCGTINDFDAEYCKICGESLNNSEALEVECPRCSTGRLIINEAYVDCCYNCGYRYDD